MVRLLRLAFFACVVRPVMLVLLGVHVRRRELLPRENPWEKTLEPLAGIAVTIGLLGSVYGFIVAFGGFRQGLDVPKVVSGLGSAYWTTGVGIVTSLVASLGSYVLGVLNR